MKNPYDILGINKNSSNEEIKKAYKRLAKKYHPDHNRGDKNAEEKMKEINIAFDILNDEKKKKMYDMYGDNFENINNQNYDFYNDIFNNSNPFDPFGDMFGFGFTENMHSYESKKGNNITKNITISFSESVFGTEKEIDIVDYEKCNNCNGTGSKSKSEAKKCPICDGTGIKKIINHNGFVQMIMDSICDNCHGTGKIIKDHCTHCHGTGNIKKNSKVKIKIPKGIHNNSTLKIKNKGEISKYIGGERGDLYLNITVTPSNIFTRENNDVYITLPISITDAALGATIKVPTIYNEEIDLKIPPETQFDKVFVLKNKGFVDLYNKNHIGKQYIKIKVIVPINLTNEQKKILKEFHNTENTKNYPEKTNFEKIIIKNNNNK